MTRHCESTECLERDGMGRCCCPCVPCIVRNDQDADRAEHMARARGEDIRAEERFQERREESVS